MTEPKPLPTLQTERLILRAFTPADAADVRRLAGDRNVAEMTMVIPHPYEDGVAEEWIAKHQETFQKGEGLELAVTRRNDGALIGAVGLGLYAKDESAQLGYWIGKPYWGHGYCTEAARKLVRYGFEELELNRIYAVHFARNPASGRVMQKIGMQQEGCLREHAKHWNRFEDCVYYGLLRGEYMAR